VIKKPKISVIVPVFNVQNYLKNCVDSILSQTFNDFEVLLINDGSTDNSGIICDEYAEKDDRIKVIHKKNEGVSAARNDGIKNANGSFLIYVDSDDYIEKTMLEDMYNNAQKTGADIVACDFYQEYLDKSVYTSAYYENKEEFFRAVLANNWGVMWKMLVKADLYSKNNIYFPPKIDAGEDYFVCVKLVFYAQKISCIKQAYYHYVRSNPNSIIAIQTEERTLNQIDSTKLVQSFLIEKGVYAKYEKEFSIRKFLAKNSLVKTNYPLWKITFPEASGAWRLLDMSFKSKLRYWLAERSLLFF